MGKIQQIDTKINQTTTLSIVANSGDVDLNESIWAVNWFNTNRRWLYNLYTTLVSPLVVKVGGKLVFKGEFQEKIIGEDRDGRKILLIINYPSARHFIELASKKIFIFLSILRILAVNRFVFGFTKRHTTNESPNYQSTKGTPCLVHHFRGNVDIKASLNKIIKTTPNVNIQLIYAGEKAATLKRSHDTEGAYEMPFIMDGIFVFAAADRTILQAFYDSDSYQAFINHLDSSYTAIFKKLM